MIVPIPYVQLGLGIAMSAISLPLVYRTVPRNHFYGIRVRKAFASEENWYDLNEYGGKLFLLFGLCLIVFSGVTWRLAPDPRSAVAPVYLAAPFLGLIPVMVLIHLRAKGLPG